MSLPHFQAIEAVANHVGDHFGLNRELLLLVANDPTKKHVLRKRDDEFKATIWVLERDVAGARYIAVASQRGEDSEIVDIVLPVPPMVKAADDPLSVLSDLCERFGSLIDTGKYRSHLVTNFSASREAVPYTEVFLPEKDLVGIWITKDDDPDTYEIVIAFVIDLRHLADAFG